MSREDNICTKSFLKTVLEYPDRKDLLINFPSMIKFIYSEKATNFCEISAVDLSYAVKIYGEDFAKLCGLLRIYELY